MAAAEASLEHLPKESLDGTEGVAISCHVLLLVHRILYLEVCLLRAQLVAPPFHLHQVFNVEYAAAVPVEDVDAALPLIKLFDIELQYFLEDEGSVLLLFQSCVEDVGN